MGSTIAYLRRRRAGGNEGTRRVPIYETSHQIVARRLVKTDGKMNEAVTMKNRVTLNGGGKRQV